MKEKLIDTAINEILREHNINAHWEKFYIPEIDGILKINYKNHTYKFHIVLKKELREIQLWHIYKMATDHHPLMVIAETLFPKIENALRKHGIAYIDMNGNINIETENVLLKVVGKRHKHFQKEQYGRAFTKTGLKVLFLFLTGENDINDTYREIAGNAGIATGNIKFFLQGLVEGGYALKLNEKELRLTNTKKLFQKWVTAYNDKLKPALHIDNFRFNDPNDFNNWKNLKLEKPDMQWGGEGAGNIYTDNLQPEILTLYTTQTKTELIKKYRLLPDRNGNIKVFKKFWKDNRKYKIAVPPVIAYADLIATASRRCIETAQKIYEQHIENTLQ